jgi:hypothetical protein
LKYIPQLVLGGLEKGILHSDATAADAGSKSTILASFACGAKLSEHVEDTVGSKRAGALAYTSIVPRVSFMFDRNDNQLGGGVGGTTMTKNERSIWLSDFVSPVSNEFGSNAPTNNADIDSRRSSDGFAAEDGWSCFGDLGKQTSDAFKVVVRFGNFAHQQSVQFTQLQFKQSRPSSFTQLASRRLVVVLVP